jgi:mannobiose 2-epimerase
MQPQQLLQEMSVELDDILQFWLTHTQDHMNGGFIGRIDSDMTVHPQAPKGLVLHARILWSFARAYRHEPRPEYRMIADRALHYLETRFRDPLHPGFFWTVDHLGQPLDTKKQIYGQAFYLYGITEYILATGRTELLDVAEELFEVIEKSFDPVHSGYVDVFARNWSRDDSLRLGEQDQNAVKTMNTHLHILEAYTNYFRVCRSSRLESQLRRLLEDTLQHIVNRENGHFLMFFEEDWTSMSDIISYGHDIEGSWLLLEAAEVLGDEALLTRTREIALQMADAVLREGVDTDGGVMWEGDASGVLDGDKHWWGQAEAVVGFLNAWQLSGEDRYWQAAANCWSFTRDHILDRTNGEWFWKTDRAGTPAQEDPKVSEWKCPYHNSRACFEIITRLGEGVQPQ